jgi:cis-3-alkyl-4-acyloxetan-2-one decarboxylase
MGWPSWMLHRRWHLHIAIDEGEGPVVLLVHGIASSSISFQQLVPLIGSKHRVIAIDLLGFGDSPVPASAKYTIEEHVTALHRAVRSLRLKAPFILVGHSLGALVSARYAADHPERVAKLVLVSPPVYLDPSALGDPRDRAAMGLYLRAYEYLRANKAFTMRAAAGLDRLSPIRHVLEVSERNWNPFALSLQNAIESQTTVSDIARVRVQVEIVYGMLDPFLMPASIRIVERMRHVTVHRVDANDHVIRKRLAKVVADVIDPR